MDIRVTQSQGRDVATVMTLKDFIVECNRGNDFFFVSGEREATEVLGNAK